ncbi:class I SAM-dependent methyltransferase [Lysinibacillus sp. NPDC093190]|uniref:class I SAM-dependent methyltransferase n=1 Tax=Lysinibacillus sp. NPDC093190 TaxID=3390575 RepID=UPI003D073831
MNFYTKQYWIKENYKYKNVHFRLEKIAKIINMKSKKSADLLDIGCGTATLSTIIREDLNYFGIDIAPHSKEPNIKELDIANSVIQFDERKFDVIVSSGLFEYLGDKHIEKMNEISNILEDRGIFIVSFSNMKHIKKPNYPSWNNSESISVFKSNLEKNFRVIDYFPAYHNTKYTEISNGFWKKLARKININIPVISKLWGIDFIFICTKKENSNVN